MKGQGHATLFSCSRTSSRNRAWSLSMPFGNITFESSDALREQSTMSLAAVGLGVFLSREVTSKLQPRPLEVYELSLWPPRTLQARFPPHRP